MIKLLSTSIMDEYGLIISCSDLTRPVSWSSLWPWLSSRWSHDHRCVLSLVKALETAVCGSEAAVEAPRPKLSVVCSTFTWSLCPQGLHVKQASFHCGLWMRLSNFHLFTHAMRSDTDPVSRVPFLMQWSVYPDHRQWQSGEHWTNISKQLHKHAPFTWALSPVFETNASFTE